MFVQGERKVHKRNTPSAPTKRVPFVNFANINEAFLFQIYGMILTLDDRLPYYNQ